MATTQLLELHEQLLEQFVMLEQYRHGDDFEGPWPRQVDAGLHMELGAVEETVEDGLIGLAQRAFEWGPGAAFVLDELAERRKGSAHRRSPPELTTLNGLETATIVRSLRLDKLYVTTAIHSVHPDPEFDSPHQRADERDPTRPRRVELLRHEEQRTALAQGFDLAKRSLEEQKRLLKGDILIEKGRAGSQEDDEPQAVGSQQGIQALAEQGGELMAGEGARDVNVA
jgi:hypothetical protein